MQEGRHDHRLRALFLGVAHAVDEVRDQLERAFGGTRPVTCAERKVPSAPCSLQPRCTSSSMAARRSLVRPEASSSGSDAERPGDRPVRLLAAVPALGERDQARPQQHPHVEVEVAGIDAELVCQLAVGELSSPFVPSISSTRSRSGWPSAFS